MGLGSPTLDMPSLLVLNVASSQAPALVSSRRARDPHIPAPHSHSTDSRRGGERHRPFLSFPALFRGASFVIILFLAFLSLPVCSSLLVPRGSVFFLVRAARRRKKCGELWLGNTSCSSIRSQISYHVDMRMPQHASILILKTHHKGFSQKDQNR